MKRYFTIVEMLVVIFIICLLAALIFPTLKKARDRAREVACMSNVHSIGQAERMYADDWDGWLPIGAYNSTVAWSGGRYPEPPWDRTWHDLLSQYVDGRIGLFYCPSGSHDKGTRWNYGASPWLLPYYAGMPEWRVGPGPKVWMAEHETYDWSAMPRDVYDDGLHSYLKDRHNGRVMTLFMDGHAADMVPERLSGHMEVWTP